MVREKKNIKPRTTTSVPRFRVDKEQKHKHFHIPCTYESGNIDVVRFRSNVKKKHKYFIRLENSVVVTVQIPNTLTMACEETGRFNNENLRAGYVVRNTQYYEHNVRLLDWGLHTLSRNRF